MHDRIGALHISYRVPRRDPAAAACMSALDRMLQAALPEALEEYLALAFGDDPTVTVIRELETPIGLDLADAALDSRLVDRVCRDTVAAVAARLAKPADEGNVARFIDDVEFAGAFIVDLLAGHAWNRWYFGAFRRYRRTDAADTLRELFAAGDIDAGRLMAWLERHGSLDPVLALLGGAEARAMLTVEPVSAPERQAAAGIPTLADAGFELLRRWGQEPPSAVQRERLRALFLEQNPDPPDWSDRRALSRWVLEWIGFLRPHLVAPPHAARRGGLDAIRALLADTFDWLDGPWLGGQLERLLEGAPSPPPSVTAARPPGLTPGQLQALEWIGTSIAAGTLHVDAAMAEDAVTARLLIAAAQATARAGPADRALSLAIAEIGRAYAALAGCVDAPLLAYIVGAESTLPPSASRLSAQAAHRLEQVRAASPAARALLRALLAATPAARPAGDATAGAGLYLLTRVLEDLRLPPLARMHGMPLPPLLGGLAAKWLGLEPPFDPATALWIGAETSHGASLDAHHERLAALGATLFDRLVDQRALDALAARASLERDAAGFALVPGIRPTTDLLLARIAMLLIRGWARWLPGVRDSSPRYLIERCLARRATALISDRSVELELEPAPLDVVVEMAGYFRPIERVPWLGERSIRFGLASALAARPS